MHELIFILETIGVLYLVGVIVGLIIVGLRNIKDE